jgi:hypothetical protein
MSYMAYTERTELHEVLCFRHLVETDVRKTQVYIEG